ncbi:MAG: hypothetical protein BWY28_00040 [bacterium ADurb.Bin236]|nr:MAG: hypothetical protein BWY28_00040 [bacterium ADurb.Bin236]HPN95488.1 hypothetical protein [bacterium]
MKTARRALTSIFFSVSFAVFAASFAVCAQNDIEGSAAQDKRTCVVRVNDEAGSGFGSAAQAALSEILRLNGCETVDASDSAPLSERDVIEFIYTIENFKTKKKINTKGALLAGGISSAYVNSVTVSARLEAVSGGQAFFNKEAEYENNPSEIYSAWRRAEGTKKRASEFAAYELASDFIVESDWIENRKNISRPASPPSDLLTKDSDVWSFVAGGFAGIAIHEAGHFAGAALTGHNARFKGNDSRTFTAGPELSLFASLLFSHRTGKDMLLPLLPDVVYDFDVFETSAGLEYADENGAPISNGARDHSLLSYSGVMFQTFANEIILTRRPDLIEHDDPFAKGIFFINVVLPVFYIAHGYSDPNSDLLLLQKSSGLDRWQVNAMVAAPAALDAYRFYHPEKKKLRIYSRIAKLIPVIVCLTR